MQIKSDNTNLKIGKTIVAKPFLRWTGSKRWLVKEGIEKFLPTNFNSYHEPFLGSGSVFFYLANQQADIRRKFYLSDSNEELINCYNQIRNNLTDVIRELKRFQNSETEYYKVRDEVPKSQIKKAARFLFLNRTSFNGIYRVNSEGKYNVPYGYRSNVDFITCELLRNASTILNIASLACKSFEKTITYVKKGDLVFIDPPYTVAHENNGFIEYNQRLFSWKDQIRLMKYVGKIKEKGAYFILTNASHNSILELYDNLGKIEKISRHTIVGGRNKTRGGYNELIIHNT